MMESEKQEIRASPTTVSVPMALAFALVILPVPTVVALPMVDVVASAALVIFPVPTVVALPMVDVVASAEVELASQACSVRSHNHCHSNR
jgi:hypothetical protein